MLRFAVSLLLALALNLVLFFFIYRIVTTDHFELPEGEELQFIDFIRMELEPPAPEVEPEKEIPDQPPPPDEPPPPPEMEAMQTEAPPVENLEMPTPKVDMPLNITGGPYLGGYQQAAVPKAKPQRIEIDKTAVPTFRVPPVYPPRAQRAGIEGVVTVEFTINEDGTVSDPKIVKAKPTKMFDRAVLNTITKWKFNPRLVDGKPVSRRASQEIRFSLQR